MITINGKSTSASITNTNIRDALNYYMHLLIPDNEAILADTNFDIAIVKGLVEQHGSVGFCCWQDTPVRPTSFLIELDADHTLNEMYKVLAHETVHAYQLLMGHWRQDHDVNKNWWHGTFVDINIVDYYDLPWEIDAHGREYGLYHRFKNKGNSTLHDQSAIIDNARSVIPMAAAFSL